MVPTSGEGEKPIWVNPICADFTYDAANQRKVKLGGGSVKYLKDAEHDRVLGLLDNVSNETIPITPSEVCTPPPLILEPLMSLQIPSSDCSKENQPRNSANAANRKSATVCFDRFFFW